MIETLFAIYAAAVLVWAVWGLHDEARRDRQWRDSLRAAGMTGGF